MTLQKEHPVGARDPLLTRRLPAQTLSDGHETHCSTSEPIQATRTQSMLVRVSQYRLHALYIKPTELKHLVCAREPIQTTRTQQGFGNTSNVRTSEPVQATRNIIRWTWNILLVRESLYRLHTLNKDLETPSNVRTSEPAQATRTIIRWTWNTPC